MPSRVLLAFLLLAACGGPGATSPDSAGCAQLQAEPARYPIAVWYYGEPGCSGGRINPCRYDGTAVYRATTSVTIRSLSSIDGECFDVTSKDVVVCPIAL